MRKDSLELDDADREAIRVAVAASDMARILVTHGTDTMVVTGRSLAAIAGKTIVMTGAMQPASVRASDAEFNVGFALAARSEEHTSELQSLMRISYAVFCLKKKQTETQH